LLIFAPGVEYGLLALNESGGLNAVDVLNLLALFLLAAVVAFFHRELGDEAFWLLGVFAFLVVFVLTSARLAVWRPAWQAVHDFSPVLLVPVIFNTLGAIIDCASPGRWDVTFGELDQRLFGELPRLWRGVLGRSSWFVDATSLAYACYYIVPVIVPVLLYRRGRVTDFRRVVFTLTLTFYASYVGYFMFPTLGPRTPPAESALVGGTVSHALRLFIDFAERTRTDAFPSGHTAIPLVCLFLAWQLSRRVFALLLPVVGGIVFSTVYLHYHYVIDVVAGAGVAAGCIWLGPRLEPFLEPHEMMRRVAVHLGMR
jgi:membrane-associated phospholipid phosphatase